MKTTQTLTEYIDGKVDGLLDSMEKEFKGLPEDREHIKKVLCDLAELTSSWTIDFIKEGLDNATRANTPTEETKVD